MLNNFFRINLPYGIAKNEKGEWMVFNREYLPLGYNDQGYKGDVHTAFNNLPIFTKYDRLTDKILEEVAYGPNGVKRNENGEIEKVFFYNDGSNPVNQSSDKIELWDNYFKRLKKLAKLKRK